MMNNLYDFVVNNSAAIITVGYKAFLSIVILTTAVLVGKGVRRTIRKANERLEKLDETLIPILCTTATYAVYTIAGIFILDIFGVNTASLIALLGAAGIAVGFALKDTLSNVAAGLMLLFLRPFRSGDFIEFGSVMGVVREINLFITVLETFDGLYVCSPNSVIWGTSITNFTRNGKRRMDIVVGIDYSDSLDIGLDVLKKIAASESRFLPAPAPQVMVASMADSSVNLQLRGWTTADDYWQTLWDLNKRVKEEIELAGLSIPFPQRSVHVVTGSGTAEMEESAG